MQIRSSAPAKLNLFLHVLGQRPDGYHNLQTVFQFLDYCDFLTFDSRHDDRIELVRPLHGVNVEDDLVYRAAICLQQTRQYKNLSVQAGATIDVEKRIPMGGGLGGGSSNAATTLVALNALWGLNISLDQLSEIGLTLGADVPVFLYGKACWAEGVGEVFDEISLAEPWYTVLCPRIHVSTREVFQAPELTRNCSPITIRDFLEGHCQEGQCRNVFEPIVRKRYPAVGTALDALDKQLAGCTEERRPNLVMKGPAMKGPVMTGSVTTGPAMTGTGACVFLACESREEALHFLQECLAQLEGDCDGFVAQGKNVSPLFESG